MWSHFVVLGTPFFNLFAGVVQIQEPMPAEALEPNRGVEAFHVGILAGLQTIAAQKGMRNAIVDETVAMVDARLAANRKAAA